MFAFRPALLLVASILVLTGCGVRGALTRPSDIPPEQETTAGERASSTVATATHGLL